MIACAIEDYMLVLLFSSGVRVQTQFILFWFADFAVESRYIEGSGGGPSYLCLPPDPKYNQTSTNFTSRQGKVKRVEYET